MEGEVTTVADRVVAMAGPGNTGRSGRPGGGDEPVKPVRLTARELDVLRLLVEGLSDPEIAGRLGLSPRTVEEHIGNLLRKTAHRNRVALAVHAVRNELV